MTFQEKLQTLRKQNGMSQEKLAEMLGISRQAVSKWESGQSYPDMDKLIALSDLFKVSIDSLIKEKQPNETGPYLEHNPSLYYPSIHYEYKSKRSLFGLPLVHINVGLGFYTAKGILAIGNISLGLLSIGGVALGGLCLGALSTGLIGLAGAALGLLLSIGGLSIGALAVGGMAIGIITLGGLSIGMFSVGGAAFASHIAIGGYANGPIAVGHTARGIETIVSHSQTGLDDISAKQVRSLILKEYPGLWKPILDWLTLFFR